MVQASVLVTDKGIVKFIGATLFSLLFSTGAFASAYVCIKGDELEVYSNLIFYGNKAQAFGPACAQEIYTMFNRPQVKVKVNGKELKVKFKISYQVEPEEAVYSSVNINTRVSNNYIRIEDKAYNKTTFRSNHDIGGNCGYYAADDELGLSTTCAHEFAHGLGLLHYNERKSSPGTDLRGTGQPGIMASRGFLVDSQYQWDPRAKAGAPGGTINPHYRIVKKQDILDLKLDKLKFDSGKCAHLGRNKGVAFTKEGKVTKGGNSYVVDALEYLEKEIKGTVSTPILCK